MLISYSLTGNMHREELEKEDPTFGGKYGCTFSLVSRDGIIASQFGLEEVVTLPNVIYANYYHMVGEQINNDGSQASKTFRAYIVGNSLEEIRDTVRFIQKTVKVKDVDGEDMLQTNFDPETITKYYWMIDLYSKNVHYSLCYCIV